MKSLIISLLICICTSSVFGQAGYEASMLELEQKIFSEENDSVRNELCLKKFNLSLTNFNAQRSFFEMKRVNDNLISNISQKNNFLWNASLVSKLKGDFEYANIYFDQYLEATNDSNTNCLILGLLIKNENDTSILNAFEKQFPQDSALACLNCLNAVKDFKMKRKGAYVKVSYLFPGLGTMMTGDFYNGFGSILTVCGSGVGMYYLISNNMYYGSAIWGYLLFWRFYTGNVRLAKTKVNNLEQKKKAKLADDCQQQIKALLKNNQIDFRLNK